MDLLALAEKIADIRQKIFTVGKTVPLDQYQENAFAFIAKRLDEMQFECRTNQLKPASQRYPELERIAVETDPAVLPPHLGGELIAVEKNYQCAR